MVLFYISASCFMVGLLIIFVGMMCKVGKLHRHFHNKSYEMLEDKHAAPSFSRSECRESDVNYVAI